MILLGWKFFYSLVIEILKYYKKEILSKKENKLSEYMKIIINNDNFCDNYNTIIKNTLCFMNDNIILQNKYNIILYKYNIINLIFNYNLNNNYKE